MPEIMDVESMQPRRVVWRAVQPQLTHCHAIEEIRFDVHEERGTTDSFTDSIDFSPSEAWPWQGIVMTILGGRLDTVNTAGPVELDFTGVVYFQFIEAEFVTDQMAELLHPPNTEVWYDHAGLDESAGFNPSALESAGLIVDGRSRVGGFCLWECESSPLVDRLVAGWRKPGTTFEQRRSVLRHLKMSCDDTGSFHIVARSVSVKRLADAEH
jgi:hypothetical protein